MSDENGNENSNPVRIRRAEHSAENRYFLMSRATAQDRELTYEARGVLAYLLSKPADWIVQVTDLQQDGCGRDKVYRILKELEACHYLKREFIRENGIIRGIEYLVSEEPFTEKPYTAQPYTAKPTLTYKRVKKQNKEDSANGKSPKPRNPMFDSVATHVFEITSDDELKAMNATEGVGSRIMNITAWLNGTKDTFKINGSGKAKSLGFISKAAEPKHVELFVKHYKKKNNGAAPPRDIEKFIEHWRAWASSLKKPADSDQKYFTAGAKKQADTTPEQRAEFARQHRNALNGAKTK